MKPRSEPGSPARAVLCAGLATLAPALGGASSLGAQAALVLALGAFLVVAPPRRSLGPWWNGLFLIAALLALAVFLPASWFPLPSWRLALAQEFGAPLPSTASPQPWLTAEATALFMSSLAAAYLFLAEVWNRECRSLALRIYAAGILMLALAAMASLLLHWKIPFWPPVGNSGADFGFFPNRNQTANALALAGIVTAALAFEDLEKGRKTAAVWFGGMALLGAGLVAAFSRAGIIIFFLGTVGWVLASFAVSKFKIGAAVCLAGISLLLAVFFLFGGETLSRFHFAPRGSPQDYRVLLQRDALGLALTAPGLGQGLGNFEPVFALTRNAALGQKRALHPESDWTWLLVEMGIPMALLLACGAGLWLWQCLPFQSGTDRALRLAAALAALGFLVHGLVDVSGHRWGGAWPALLLFALARHPKSRAQPSAWAAPLGRVAGCALFVTGGWWALSCRSPVLDRWAPTSRTLERQVASMDTAREAGQFPEAIASADRALGIAPLDWRLYYQRAVSRGGADWPLWLVERDFATARFLEPQWVELCVGEGDFWLAVKQPQNAVTAWLEALRRAGDSAPALFQRLLSTTSREYNVREALERLARTKIEYLLLFLESAGRLECENEIALLLAADPGLRGLSGEQRRRLFQAWGAQGDRASLYEVLLAHPEWEPDGWRWLANYFEEQHEFERAYSLARKFGGAPALPDLHPTRSIGELERDFVLHADNLQKGLELFAAYRSERQTDDALATLRALRALPHPPAYLHFLEAEVLAERGEWQKAWEASLRYRGASSS